MRKRIWIIIAAVILALAAAYWPAGALLQYAFEKQLGERIQMQLKGTDAAQFRMETVADFDWDRLYVFRPYTPESEISNALGVKWVGSTSIEYSKGISLVVFMKDGHIVRYAELPRAAGDFIVDTSSSWQRKDAVFSMHRLNGWTTIEPVSSGDAPKPAQDAK